MEIFDDERTKCYPHANLSSTAMDASSNETILPENTFNVE